MATLAKPETTIPAQDLGRVSLGVASSDLRRTSGTDFCRLYKPVFDEPKLIN